MILESNQNQRFKIFFSPYFIFSVFTAFGFFLRIYIGSGVSFHTDEGQFVFVTHLKSLFQIRKYISEYSSSDQPMMMYFITYVWKSLFDSSQNTLRILPTLFSTLSIFFTGYFCLRLTKNNFLSIATCLFVAISPISVRYAYDLTPYALMGLLAPISFFIFINQLNHKKYVPSLSLMATNIIAMNTHYYFYFTVTAQLCIFFYFILFEKKLGQLKNFILASCSLFISAALPFILVFRPKAAEHSQGWIRAFKHDFFNDVLVQTIGFHRPFFGIYFAVFITLIGFYFFQKYKREKPENYFFKSLAFYAITLAVIKIAEQFAWPVLGHSRYLTVLFPIQFFILALCMDQISNIRLKYAALILFATILLTEVVKTQPHINQDFSGAFTHLEKNEKESPFVLFNLPSNYNKPLAHYYSTYYTLNNIIIPDNQILDPQNIESMNNLLDDMEKKGITKAYFLHYYLSETGVLRDQYIQRFGDFFEVGQATNFKDINLYEMKLKKRASVKHAK